MTGGSPEATGTPQFAGDWSGGTPSSSEAFGAPDPLEAADAALPVAGTIDGTRFAHASEAEMARILDFYAVRWEYEPTTFPILWNLDGEVVESFAPDFYLPELELFLEMTTLKQRLVRKKNRKLRRMRELYPDIRIKLFYARDFRAMMLKYGRLALAEALSGTPGQMVPERAAAAATEPTTDPLADVESAGRGRPSPSDEPAPSPEPPIVPSVVRASPRTRSRRRRRRPLITIQAGAEEETGA